MVFSKIDEYTLFMSRSLQKSLKTFAEQVMALIYQYKDTLVEDRLALTNTLDEAVQILVDSGKEEADKLGFNIYSAVSRYISEIWASQSGQTTAAPPATDIDGLHRQLVALKNSLGQNAELYEQRCQLQAELRELQEFSENPAAAVEEIMQLKAQIDELKYGASNHNALVQEKRDLERHLADLRLSRQDTNSRLPRRSTDFALRSRTRSAICRIWTICKGSATSSRGS